MARQIVWNKRAIARFEEIVGYLEQTGTQKTAINFVIHVDDLIEKLNKYPEIGRRTKKKKTVRQYRIDKYRKLYYRKHGKKLIIVYFFDDRWNPTTNPYK